MIVTRTPFRVSFAGGGTDMAAFYTHETGHVVSTAIRKYMYITVNRRFDNTIRVSYSQTEIVDKVEQIRHPIVRASLKLTGIEGGIEIVSIADIPAGTGLGSSSSFTVGLLNALYAYRGVLKSAEDLARDACRIEIDILNEPIGKQDQYIAAYGGMCHLQFNPDGSVFVNPLLCEKNSRDKMQEHILLLYTGDSRQAKSILTEQSADARQPAQSSNLRKIAGLAQEARACFLNGGSPQELGRLLHQGWLLKKKLARGISNDSIDEYYARALSEGAYGGKIAGAGGGGFLVLVTPPHRRERVKKALAPLREMDFAFESEGSKIIYVV